MARRDEILKENRGFYCDTYYKRRNGWFAIFLISSFIITGVLALRIKNLVLWNYYFAQASLEGTNGREVEDYIVSKIGSAGVNGYIWIIIIAGVLMTICSLLFRIVIKNYDMYKYRAWITGCPLIVSALEFIAFFFMLGSEVNIFTDSPFRGRLILGFVLFAFNLAPQVLSSRLFVTWDLRKADEEWLLKILDFFADRLLERM